MAKVLIVDDKVSNLFALENVLKRSGVEIVKAMSGDEALRAALNHDFALAILDVKMPGMDGYELATLLRSDGRTRNVPIIFLSAEYSEEPYVFRGYESGGVDFITKPYNSEVLLSKMRVFLELNEQKTKLVEQKARLETLVCQLEEQIEARKKTETALEKARAELEQRVDERTSELIIANRQLRHEMQERIRVMEALSRSERQLRSLSSQLLLAQEEERKRLSRELHDSIGGTLSAIKFGLESALDKMAQDAPAAESLRKLVSISQLAIDESRRIYNDLRPTVLDDLGILATIAWFCRQYGEIYSEIRVDREIDVQEEDILESLKVVIFRVLQEAFHNIAKYSKASVVSLRLSKTGGAIQLVVRDNGIGFDLESVSSARSCGEGLGLTTMKERTELSGGVFVVESLIGEGTEIRASWPHQC